jgi:SAM-dependent methyltransferase
MRMFLRKSASSREPLPVAMIGVRMGERVVQIGLADVRLMITLAAKPGISGRSALVVRDDRDAVRAQSAAADAGTLIETHVTHDAFPFDEESFDVAIMHDADGPLAECHRVLRAGGRLVVIEPGSRAGLAALLQRGRREPAGGSNATIAALQRAGFKAVRMLADKDGYRFIEGLRARA